MYSSWQSKWRGGGSVRDACVSVFASWMLKEHKGVENVAFGASFCVGGGALWGVREEITSRGVLYGGAALNEGWWCVFSCYDTRRSSFYPFSHFLARGGGECRQHLLFFNRAQVGSTNSSIVSVFPCSLLPIVAGRRDFSS